ncbi:MAG: aspartate aminotransferase family protein [Bacteroidales bacterium]|nr:aspartate aminotransferase family protein [Bacteroidales bacterium]
MFSRRQLFLDHIAQTSLTPMMLEISSAQGVFVYDTHGKKYFDLISGVNVSSLGHAHPKVVEAVKTQADKYLHAMVYGEYLQEPQIEYASLITSCLPENLSSVYFVNSGSEAIEGAIKLARKYTGRAEILSFCNAYHGSTIGALSLMGGEYYKEGYYPMVPGVRHLAFNNFDDLDKITSKTACVVAEVVQAEAGMILPEEGFLKALRDRCASMGTLLVLDEIQTGLGRLGTLFGFERFGIVPDILVLAKSFGGGMPLGAFIASREIMEVLSYNPALGHITTFGGNPVCCAAGKACLETLLDEDLILSVRKKEQAFRDGLASVEGLKIRGTGLMLAVEMGSMEKMMRVVQEGLSEGFVTDWFLFCDTAFRISPPLNISFEEIGSVCKLLENAIRKANDPS